MKRIGILGGGQLGRMMFMETIGLNLDIHFLDQSLETPVGNIAANFEVGDFTNYEDVLAFGKDKDIIGIEIEKVNIQALYDLRELGKTIHPRPESLEIIQDKGAQKEFYIKNQLPTSDFKLMKNKADILSNIDANQINYPFVQKARKDGYDGQGVAIIHSVSDQPKLLDVPSIVEPLVDIKKELAVIAIRNESGEIQTYPCVEMAFDPIANLVKYLYSPADVPLQISEKCKTIAIELIEKFEICGLLAVEFFYTNDQKVLINEVAPRPHNSGHHTIDAMYCSQFENQLRGICNFPLGSTKQHTPAAMINLVGEEGYKGPVKFKNLDTVLSTENAHLHLYGKKETRPNRKMGHVNILGNSRKDIELKIETIQSNFQIIS